MKLTVIIIDKGDSLAVKTFQDFFETRDRIVSGIDSATAILSSENELLLGKSDSCNEKPSTLTSVKSCLADQKSRLLEGVFKLLVVGEFSTGKSTFLNALLQKNALPVGVRPTTAAISIIRHGNTPHAVVRYWGAMDQHGNEITEGDSETIAFEDLTDYSTSLTFEADERSKKVKIVELYIPNDYCRDNIEILDTPGLASANEHHERITLEYLPKGNACIMLLNPTQPLSKSEREYLRVIRHYVSKVLFVANKIDLLDPAERAEALDYMDSELEKELKTGQAIDIHPLSSKNAANKGWEGSGFTEFVRDLESFLTSDERALQMLLPPASTVRRQLNSFCNSLNMRVEALTFSPDEFEQQMAKIRPELREIEKSRSDFRRNLNLLSINSLRFLKGELEEMLDTWISTQALKIESWQGDPEALESYLKQDVKESLANLSSEFNKTLNQEWRTYTLDAITRIKSIEERISKLQDSFSRRSHEAIKMELGVSSEESMLEQVTGLGVLAGGTFMIGFIGALLMSGPIGWILTLAGGGYAVKWYNDVVRARKLSKMSEEFKKQADSQRGEIVEKAMDGIRSGFSAFDADVDNSLKAMISSLTESLHAISREMENERQVIGEKRKSLTSTIKQLQQVCKGIEEIERSVCEIS